MTIVDRVWRWSYKLKDVGLKKQQISAFLRPGSNLFYSMIVDGKNEFLKKLLFVLRTGIFSAFLVGCNVGLAGIKKKCIDDVHYLRHYKKGKVICTNDEPEGTQNQVLDIFPLLKNP